MVGRNGRGEVELASAEARGAGDDATVASREGAAVGANAASGEEPRAEGEREGEREGDNPTRLFSIGAEGTQAPLAVVFKRRKAGGRRQNDGEGRVDPRADEGPPEGEGERIAASLTPARGLAAPEPVQAEYDVVLTDAYRVTREEGPTPPAPAVAAAEEHDDSMDSADDTEPSGVAGLADLPADVDPLAAMDAILGLARRQATDTRERRDDAWFARLFSAEYLLAHPRRSDPATEAEVEFLDEMLGVARGARLLDLACGYGRHTLRLARRGYEMVGLDLSMDMLKMALSQAQADALSIKFVHGDMRDLNFKEVFDGAFCFDTSFGYFGDAENLVVLRGLHDALKRGGRLLLDVVNRDHAIRDVPLRNWWEGDGCLVQEDIEFDSVSSRLQVKRFVVFADGLQREFDISLRLFSLHELKKMLHLVGFEVLRVSGGTHTPGAFFGAESRRLMVLAQKVDRRRRA